MRQNGSEKKNRDGTALNRKRRGGRTALAGLAALGVLTLALTLFTLANRPHWRTVTLTGNSGDAAIAFDCPDNWIIVDRQPETYTFSDGTTRLTLRRDPPTGWLRWWNAHVLHLSEHSFNSPEIVAEVLAAHQVAHRVKTSGVFRVKSDGTITVAFLVLPNYRRRTERVSHPLGPAIQTSVDINLNTPGRASPGGKTWLPRHIESLDITPSETKEQSIGLITISCAAPTQQYPQLKSLFNRVMQSVRFVRKKSLENP